MYRGENQDYIYTKKWFPTHSLCNAGEVSPECLKRVFFWKSFPPRKVACFSFGILKDIDEITKGKECIRVRMYRGNFVHGKFCFIMHLRNKQQFLFLYIRGRTGLMVRASDSGSGDPGSILGRVGVFVSLSKRHLLPKSTGNTQE